ncbi:MAG: N-acetylmuramic acid 6-phosphate etherase [bacterium (Candidatus Stahlbacteria) CG08_land_8_20_14_0_20_40_26]|nr:MAG: N-acetylmuramic acid 6-phosphate etherase [bacterium (Candidatus Stahlbacteria) CG23_combo_of_CG06-09_8_20_14_all_40_9]PIS24583.1 MAG: N-acetylmuramic acid 6-phosphate etherase [bacterium (Candidatus Stahlbacteria) CG08_land_8_20_14_0_20_40_26]
MKKLFDELKNIITEQINPDTMDIDSKSIEEILVAINNEDRKVAPIVADEIPYIAKGVEMIAESLKQGGRLIYVGAGTSGRLGVLDAAECPPTFGTSPEQIQGIIAGGYGALVRAVEGAEDKKTDGARAIEEKEVTNLDTVVGITACKRTPYVIGAIEEARKRGAKTIYITATPRDKLKVPCDVAICPVTGPEVIMGSTRMKAGTATKLVLNMLTTASMIKIGKVYENMMVDLQPTSEKLIERAKKTIMIVTGVEYDKASRVLKEAKYNTKTAIVMILANVDYKTAKERLEKCDGFVRKAISSYW